MKNRPYRELVGGLIYLSNATRPDLSFAASALSRFCSNPGITHWKMAKRTLRYIQHTINYGITYTKSNQTMKAFCDSDWAGDVDDRRSCSGNVVILAGGPISWSCKKQKSVAASTMQAEYVALSEVTKEVIYLKRLMTHMCLDKCVKGATTVHCDNQSAIKLSTNSVYHSRSKHIDIRYHITREAQEDAIIKVQYLPTDLMCADVLTKPLSKIKHEKCVNMLNIR
ncbi:uncharacterized protein LOC143362255 [Halictus rubicundus]|uniref:uncharacterized protein LOC143362255 n=1 Tax=Halictus rubicundus TaxID=77578 RepID=UPI00403608FD